VLTARTSVAMNGTECSPDGSGSWKAVASAAVSQRSISCMEALLRLPTHAASSAISGLAVMKSSGSMSSQRWTVATRPRRA
jgi:hypothetical protein